MLVIRGNHEPDIWVACWRLVPRLDREHGLRMNASRLRRVRVARLRLLAWSIDETR